jgi:hypothetical protein
MATNLTSSKEIRKWHFVARQNVTPLFAGRTLIGPEQTIGKFIVVIKLSMVVT